MKRKNNPIKSCNKIRFPIIRLLETLREIVKVLSDSQQMQSELPFSFLGNVFLYFLLHILSDYLRNLIISCDNNQLKINIFILLCRIPMQITEILG